MADIETALIRAATSIETKVETTAAGKKYGRVWIGDRLQGGSVLVDVALLSNDSTQLRRLAANITALADNLDRATS